MRRPPPAALATVTIVLLVMSATGCGKKGDPVLNRGILPATIEAVEVTVADEGIGLRWSVQGEAASLERFNLFRSEPVQCPGCPREYRPWRQLPLTDGRLRREGERAFRFVDREAGSSGSYGYRVVGCDRQGRCTPPSPEGLTPPGR